MADYVTSITTIGGLRSWFDSTVPSSVSAGDNYIAELAAGAYDAGSVSDTWNGKTVATGGRITIRAATAARLTSPTRVLRASAADGVCLNGSYTALFFNQDRLTLEGLQFISTSGSGGSLALGEDPLITNCLFYKVGLSNYSGGNARIQDSALVHDYNNTILNFQWNGNVLENVVIHNFGTGQALYCGGATTTAKNSIFVSGGSDAVNGVSSFGSGSTNNAFNVGTTYGAAPITITPSAQFENVASLATSDMRLKSGASLATAGDGATVSRNDIYWQAYTTAAHVGAWLPASGTPSLVIADAAHGHAADGIVLTSQHSLTVAEAAHGHLADNVALSVLGTLAIDDALHAHLADSITLTASGAGTITIPAVRDWHTGNLKTGETGVQVDIRNISTGALVVRKTGQTTHATTGVCVVKDSSIVSGTAYEVVVRATGGFLGIGDVTATNT